MTPGWERAARFYAGELADALGADPVLELPALLAMVRDLVADRDLARLQLAETSLSHLALVESLEPREWLTVDQAARAAHVAPQTIGAWERRGLPVDRHRTRRPRIDRADLDRWLAVHHPRPRLEIAS